MALRQSKRREIAMAERKFSESHEWVEADGDVYTIGITDYAQKELGNIVFLEVQAQGTELKQGDTFGTIESVKAVSDLIAPISGSLEAINDGVIDSPEQVNDAAESSAWIIKIKASNPDEISGLMDKAAYDQLVSE